MNKVEKNLQFTCSACSAAFRLLEIHQPNGNCPFDCLTQWEKILHEYHQQQIILHLAQAEAQKENHE